MNYLFVIWNSLGGAVAQLGECLTGSQEVGGSNPLSSTIFFRIFDLKVIPVYLCY
jgi:uncharacterized protein with LGFP repeats